jgi:hypothetical protein
MLIEPPADALPFSGVALGTTLLEGTSASSVPEGKPVSQKAKAEPQPFGLLEIAPEVEPPSRVTPLHVPADCNPISETARAEPPPVHPPFKSLGSDAWGRLANIPSDAPPFTSVSVETTLLEGASDLHVMAEANADSGTGKAEPPQFRPPGSVACRTPPLLTVLLEDTSKLHVSAEGNSITGTATSGSQPIKLLD